MRVFSPLLKGGEVLEITPEASQMIREAARAAVKPAQAAVPQPVAARIAAALDAAGFFEEALAGDVIENALKSANVAVTEKTLELAKQAVSHNMPLTAETLKTLNQALRLMGGDVTKALFLAESGAKLTAANASALNELAGHAANALAAVSELAEAVADMPEGAVKQAVVKALTEQTPDGAAPRAQAAAPPEETAFPGETARNPQSGRLTPPPPETNASGGTPSGQAAPEPGGAAPPPGSGVITEAGSEAETGTRRIYEAENGSRAPGDNPPAENLPAENQTEKTVVEQITNRFKFTPASPQEEIDRKLTDLVNRLSRAVKILSEPGAAREAAAETEEPEPRVFKTGRGEDAPKAIPREKALEPAERLIKTIAFANDVKNIVVAHMPLKLEDREANAELYVFRDKRGKKTAKSGGSALLAVDTASIGRVEAYIKRDGSSVTCQFRVPEETSARIAPHADKLSSLLKEKGYSLAGFSFTDPGRRFSVVDGEPGEKSAGLPISILDERA